MKKIIYLFLLSTVLTLTTACSSQFEEPIATSQQIADDSDSYIGEDSVVLANSTRGNDLTTKLDDATVDIVKADLVGAIEGAIKAMDYAMDQNMNEDEAIGLIVISAVVHGAARSHQAYINHKATEYGFITCSTESPDRIAVSSTLSKDIVRVSESEEVSHNNWIGTLANDATFSKKYANAVSVAQKHNAILSVIKEKNGFNGFNSFEVSIANLPLYQANYLRSSIYHNSLNSTVRRPTDFTGYTNVDVNDSHYNAKSTAGRFLSRMNREGRSVNDYKTLMMSYTRLVEQSKDLSSYEKECLYIGLFVGQYSMLYWAVENPLN